MIRNATYSEIIEDYCESVLSGDIVACKLLIKAVEKFMAELEASYRQSEEFPYEFDTSAVQRYCDVFPRFLRHSKGEWAGRPFDLEPWQVFILGNMFGWKRRSDGTRRFRKVFLSVARKNGKTAICAGLEIIFLMLDCEAGAEVWLAATKKDQAKLIHDEAELMLRQSPPLMRHVEIFKNNISFPKKNAFARPTGSDKPYSGPSPSAVLLDEFHEWREQHRKFFGTITTGGGARQQPMQVIITTASDQTGLLYHEEANYSRDVISGEIRDDALFSVIFELDKDDDPFSDDFEFETLGKANPNLGVSVNPDHMAQQILEARNKPAFRNEFIRYHGNRCVTSVEDAITAEMWDAAAGPLSDWKNADGIAAGFDLGGQDDLSSYALVAKFKVAEDEDGRPIYRYEATSKSFIDQNTKRRDLTHEPFASWIHNGKLIACEYVTATLRQHLAQDCIFHGIEYIAYDYKLAIETAEALEREGLKPVKMTQSCSHFNEVMRNYLIAIGEGRFKPDETDVVLRWCALNMAIKTDPAGLMMPDKKHSKEKIDAAVAMLMAKRASYLAQPRITGSLVM